MKKWKVLVAPCSGRADPKPSDGEWMVRGEYATQDAAIQAGEEFIRGSLAALYEPGMSAHHLYYTVYRESGYSAAVIEGGDTASPHWVGSGYAWQQCNALIPGRPRVGKDPLAGMTRRLLLEARYSLPPTRNMSSAPHLSQVQNVRMFPVLDGGGNCIAELSFTWKAGAWHFERTPFINNFEEALSMAAAGELQAAAAEKDWPTLDRFHPEALPWYCRTCARNYEQAAWQISPRFESDGWLDSYRGVCPQGHERMIAD